MRFVLFPIPWPKNLWPGAGAQGALRKVLILGNDNPTFGLSEIPNRPILSLAKAQIPRRFGPVARCVWKLRQSGRPLRIDQKAHLTIHQYGMVEVTCRIGQGGPDILRLEIGIAAQDFVFGGPISEHINHILNPNAWPPATRI